MGSVCSPVCSQDQGSATHDTLARCTSASAGAEVALAVHALQSLAVSSPMLLNASGTFLCQSSVSNSISPPFAHTCYTSNEQQQTQVLWRKHELGEVLPGDTPPPWDILWKSRLVDTGCHEAQVLPTSCVLGVQLDATMPSSLGLFCFVLFYSSISYS